LRVPRNGLTTLPRTTPNTHPFVCDVTDADRLSAVIEEIRQQLGAPKIVVHNAVGG
jgi:NAD(P)-dependent dehydrogenase (short-subunit alcohol dehydrogenase family)